MIGGKFSFNYDDEHFVNELEKESTLVAIVGIKTPTKKNVHVLYELLKKANIQVIVCSGGSMENISAFAEETGIGGNEDINKKYLARRKETLENLARCKTIVARRDYKHT